MKEKAPPVVPLHNLNETAVELSVVLLQKKIPVKDLLDKSVGSIIQFDIPTNAAAYLSLNGQKFASGKVVEVDGNYALEINTIHH